jgi:hypothetical protein
MYVIRRLKPDRDFNMILLPFGVLVVGALLATLYSFKTACVFIAVFFWIYAAYSFLTFIRTQNAGFVVVVLFQASAGLVVFTVREATHRGDVPPIVLFLVALEFFFLVWLVILTANKQMKWRGREVLELAAAPIEKVGNGYTPRPLPAGKTEFSHKQIIAFAEFTRQNLVAVPYVGKDRVIFVPVMQGREYGFILGWKRDYTDETWVAFDFDGNVTVNISHRDYLEYDQALAFDQLCESLGTLFIDFMGLFHRGEGVRIIDQMNALKIPYFS